MQNKIKYILYALIALVISGCSTTRRIEADEMLYTGVKDVEFAGSVTPEVCVQDEIELAVDVAPNKYTITPSMRIPIGLWVYNNWNPEAGGLKGWMYRKLVEEPVLVSDVRPEVRTKMIDEILADNGYFRGSSSYTLNQGKNKKKASITYSVNAGPAYKLDSIIMLPDTCRLYHLIDSVASRDS